MDALRAALATAGAAVSADANGNSRQAADLYAQACREIRAALDHHAGGGSQMALISPAVRAQAESKCAEYAKRCTELGGGSPPVASASASASASTASTTRSRSSSISHIPAFPEPKHLGPAENCDAAEDYFVAGDREYAASNHRDAFMCYTKGLEHFQAIDSAHTYASRKAGATPVGLDPLRHHQVAERCGRALERAEALKRRDASVSRLENFSSTTSVEDAGGDCSLCHKPIPLDHRYAQHDGLNYHLPCVHAVQQTVQTSTKDFLLGGSATLRVQLDRRWEAPGSHFVANVQIKNPSSHEIRGVKATLKLVESQLAFTAAGNERRITKEFKAVKQLMRGNSSSRAVVWPLKSGSCEFLEEFRVPEDMPLSETSANAGFHREYELVFKLDHGKRHGLPPKCEFGVKITTEVPKRTT